MVVLARVDSLRSQPTPFDERPMLAIWELTQACDLACVHCRASAVKERDPRELTTDEGKRLLDDIREMGTPLVVFTGGDPANRPDLVELVGHAAKIGLVVAVTPSGTELFQRPLLERLKAAGMARIAVSVDGPDAKSHDGFRRVEGSFAHSIRILEDAKSLGIERQINFTLAPQNVGCLREIADLASRLEVALLSVFVVVQTGRADAALLLSAERLEVAFEELAALADGASFDVKTTAAPHFRRVLLERRARLAAVGVTHDVDADGNVLGPRGINDGSGFVFVSHRGDIFPSGFLPLHAGNIRTDSLAEVYRSSPIFRQLRDTSRLTGKCGACPFKRVCGGSRARAFSVSHDLSASDPACAFVPRGWDSATMAVVAQPPTSAELEADVRRALHGVIDPELGIDIVDLGLVYAIAMVGTSVRVDLTMTTAACPLGEHIALDAKTRLESLPGVSDVEVRLVWDPPWDPSRMAPTARAALGWAQ